MTAPTKAAETNVEENAAVVQDVVCAGCSCMCDDINVAVRDNRIVSTEHACELGRQWFQVPNDAPGAACTIDGIPAAFSAAVDRAAQILLGAKYPLIYGLAETTCEAQRVAVAIADWTGANLDTSTSAGPGLTGMAFSGVGEVTSSLGEIANRADLLIFWRCNPAVTHPRHFERYSLFPHGMFVPNGRDDRTCVVVDLQPTKSSVEADLFLQIKPDSDFEALWVLRALTAGVVLDAAVVENATGVPLPTWQGLIDQMKQAHFGVLLFGTELASGRGKQLNSEALFALVHDLNAHTRIVARPLRGQGNATGADNVVTWQTGYPLGVNLSRGYPRFGPTEFTARELLQGGEADAILLVGCNWSAELSKVCQDHLRAQAWISISPRREPSASVAFATAHYGIQTAGTVYRMDDIPLPLRPPLSTNLPDDVTVLTAIEQRIKLMQSEHASLTRKAAQP